MSQLTSQSWPYIRGAKNRATQCDNTHFREHVFHKGYPIWPKLGDPRKDKHGSKLAPNSDDSNCIVDWLEELSSKL